jgi:YHS domain-containing protein
MKRLKLFAAMALAGCCLALPVIGLAGNTNSVATPQPKPDLLTTCPVSGEKLGDMAPPCVFTYQGQEVKLCCSGCKKDFDQDPARYLAKIRAADKDTTAKKGAKN